MFRLANIAAGLCLATALACLAAGPATAPSMGPSNQLSSQARAVMAQLRYGDSAGVDAIVNPDSGSDPIGPLADKMQDVVGDLSAVKTDAPVQAKQKDVVNDLSSLIAQLEEATSGKGGGNPNPSRPMARSVLAAGPGGSGPLHDAQSGTRLWGQLPPKERQEILQSQTEGFPPGYESVLAGYFSRLAQGQSAADTGAATQPAEK